MRLIRNTGNNTILRQLTKAEAESVRRYCGAGMQTQAHDAQVVEAILAEMHNGKEPRYWLECDCRDGEAIEERPRMTARIRADGPRHFVRIAGRDAHSCVLKTFRTDPSEDEDDPQGEPGKHPALHPIRNSLDYLDKVYEMGGKRPSKRAGGGSGPNRGRRLPKLGRILYTLLEQAGFSAVSTDDLDTSQASLTHWDRLERFAVEEEVTEALTLWDMMKTRAWTKPVDFMADIDKLQWPKGKKRMGYLLFVADKVTASARHQVDPSEASCGVAGKWDSNRGPGPELCESAVLGACSHRSGRQRRRSRARSLRSACLQDEPTNTSGQQL